MSVANFRHAMCAPVAECFLILHVVFADVARRVYAIAKVGGACISSGRGRDDGE